MGFSGVAVVVLTGALGAGAVVVASAVLDDEGPSGSRTTVTRVIDGDTVEIASGEHVRLIGVDTPEGGTCGYAKATEALRRMVEGEKVRLVNPGEVQDLDKYDRLLRYVEVDRKDVGLAQIRAGRASARYDSQDGYDPHPREQRYRESDRRHAGVCERQERLRQERQRIREERWDDARALASRANIKVRRGETAVQVIRRARAVLHHRQLARQAARAPALVPAPTPAPSLAPAPPSPQDFVPPPGWTTDALTPGYSGCRQGYPGGYISGVYVWKPISC